MTLCFAMFSLFLEFRATTRLRLFLISETGLKLFIWTHAKIVPGKRASQVNRAADVKIP